MVGSVANGRTLGPAIRSLPLSLWFIGLLPVRRFTKLLLNPSFLDTMKEKRMTRWNSKSKGREIVAQTRRYNVTHYPKVAVVCWLISHDPVSESLWLSDFIPVHNSASLLRITIKEEGTGHNPWRAKSYSYLFHSIFENVHLFLKCFLYIMIHYCSMIRYKQKNHTVIFPVLDTSAQDSGIATWNRPRISPTWTLCLTEAPGKAPVSPREASVSPRLPGPQGGPSGRDLPRCSPCQSSGQICSLKHFD